VHSPRHVRRWIGGAAATAAVVLVSSTLNSAPATAGPDVDSSAFRAEVTTAGITEHLQALQAIGAANDNTRASGTPGYDASVDYVVERLTAAGYDPTVQTFEFPFFRENSPSTLAQTSPDATTYINPNDFQSMTYSASGDVTNGTVVPVDTTATPVSATPAENDSTSGCEASDFTAAVDGAVALMQRGTCPFGQKVANAQTAGAVAAIVFNRGSAGSEASFAGTLGAPQEGQGIPALGASFAVGQDLYDPSGTTVSITSDTESEIRDTYNVHAQTESGNARRVIHAGAHLDSVVPGPGVNDNGSGSASILEVAEAMADEAPVNKVRFSWWGAEELNLLGSQHYVSDLSSKQLSRIALYLNFDMVGSPNYVRFVYDGDNSAFPVGPGAAEGPPGSGQIEALFHDYFESQELASDETPFSGRSDYGPFIAEGIPAGGLFTGAEGAKTEAQAAVYGGQAGVAYDRCYHQACDGIGNVNMRAIGEMSGAIAHAVWVYSQDASSVTGASAGGTAVRGTGTGELRQKAHDYDAPNHHAARR
jgi:Zn-dependent M28 family amino/carboxypeptidase